MGRKKARLVTNRQKYSSQFKEQAVERSNKEGVPKTAKDLGISKAMLYSWRKQVETIGISFEDQKLQQAELARLKRENSRLSEENAFLKKAAAYFAKEPKRGTL